MMKWLLNIEINQGTEPFKNISKINGNKHDYTLNWLVET
jgi:hypothetical protein